MRVLLLGSGGREHALAWKMAQSSILEALFIAPGNAGTRQHGVNLNVSASDFDGVKKGVFIRQAENTSEPFVGQVWPGDVAFPDFMNSAAVNWWKDLVS